MKTKLYNTKNCQDISLISLLLATRGPYCIFCFTCSSDLVGLFKLPCLWSLNEFFLTLFWISKPFFIFLI